MQNADSFIKITYVPFNTRKYFFNLMNARIKKHIYLYAVLCIGRVHQFAFFFNDGFALKYIFL